MYAIMRTKKHKIGGGGLKAALQHLHRERPTPNANPDIQNKHWSSDGEQSTEASMQKLHSKINETIKLSGRKPRIDAVVAVEYVMTASPEYFAIDDPVEREKRISDFAIISRQWISETYPQGEIIAAQIHMDETTPHVSLFVTPTFEKSRKQRDGEDKKILSFDAKTILGGKKALSEHQTSFADAMKPLGLKRGIERSTAKHDEVHKFYGRLKELKGTHVEILKTYNDEIDKQESKIIGGKANLAELARKMAENIATLKHNHTNLVSADHDQRVEELEKSYEHKLKEQERQFNLVIKAEKSSFKILKNNNDDEINSYKNEISNLSKKNEYLNKELALADILIESSNMIVKKYSDPLINKFTMECQLNYMKMVSSQGLKKISEFPKESQKLYESHNSEKRSIHRI
jgi:hypothetical protein